MENQLRAERARRFKCVYIYIYRYLIARRAIPATVLTIPVREAMRRGMQITMQYRGFDFRNRGDILNGCMQALSGTASFCFRVGMQDGHVCTRFGDNDHVAHRLRPQHRGF